MDGRTDAVIVPWADYLASPRAAGRYKEKYQTNLRAFARQREILRRDIRATRPRGIACLGAGARHDIPYRMLVRDGVEIHLADWQAEALEVGLAEAVTRASASGPPACLYCALNEDDAGRCAAYVRGARR